MMGVVGVDGADCDQKWWRVVVLGQFGGAPMILFERNESGGPLSAELVEFLR